MSIRDLNRSIIGTSRTPCEIKHNYTILHDYFVLLQSQDCVPYLSNDLTGQLQDVSENHLWDQDA